MTNFSIPTNQAVNLVNSADGMKPYDASTGWGAYPERNADQWGIALKNDGTIDEDTFVKSSKDGGMDAKEKDLAATQIAYDVSSTARGSNKLNKNPITGDFATQAKAFLCNIFWGNSYQSPEGMPAINKGDIRGGLDTNNNGVFDAEDIRVIANKDGDSLTISSKDFEIAQSEYMDKAHADQVEYFKNKNK